MTTATRCPLHLGSSQSTDQVVEEPKHLVEVQVQVQVQDLVEHLVLIKVHCHHLRPLPDSRPQVNKSHRKIQ